MHLQFGLRICQSFSNRWMDFTEPAAGSPRFWPTTGPGSGKEGSRGVSPRERTGFTATKAIEGAKTASVRAKARGAGGPDKPGAQGYVGGPALDAGPSCVTLGGTG